MANAKSNIRQRFMFKYLPFLYKRCPAGNYHKRWDRLCFCRMNEHCGDWHGGVFDLKTGEEYEFSSIPQWIRR